MLVGAIVMHHIRRGVEDARGHEKDHGDGEDQS